MVLRPIRMLLENEQFWRNGVCCFVPFQSRRRAEGYQVRPAQGDALGIRSRCVIFFSPTGQPFPPRGTIGPAGRKRDTPGLFSQGFTRGLGELGSFGPNRVIRSIPK
jgi:hypothetical protein